MRALVILCVCTIVAGKPVRLVETKNTCDAPVATLLAHAISQDVLYNTAFELNSHSDITGWTYERVPRDKTQYLTIAKRNTELQQSSSFDCVRVKYSMLVKMPAFASRFSSLVRVDKSVCKTEDTVFERLELAGLPLVGSLTVAVNMKFSPGSMFVTTATDVVLSSVMSLTPYVPGTVATYIQKRWSDKNEVFVQQLCLDI